MMQSFMNSIQYVRSLFAWVDPHSDRVSTKRDRTEDDLSDDETPAMKKLKQLRRINFSNRSTNNDELKRSDRSKSVVRQVPIQIEKHPSTSTPLGNSSRERIIPIKFLDISENGLGTPSRRTQMHSPVMPVTHAIIDDDEDDDPEVTLIESNAQKKKFNKISPKYYIDLDDTDSVTEQQENEDDVIFVKRVSSPPTHKAYKYFVSKNKSPQSKYIELKKSNIEDNENTHSQHTYSLFKKVKEHSPRDVSSKIYSKFKLPPGISKPYKKIITPIPNWMQPVKSTYPSLSKSHKNNYSNLNGNARSALCEIFNLDEKRNYEDLIKKAAAGAAYKPLTVPKTSEILNLVDDSATFRSTQRIQKKALNDLKFVEKGLIDIKELEAKNEYDPITVASINSSDSEVEIIASGSSTSSSVKIDPVNSFKDSLRDKPIVANDWLTKLDSKYKKKRQETLQKLCDARRESDIISKVNYEQKLAQLEHKLKYELSIPESLIEETLPTAELPELTPDQEKLVNRALGPGPAGQLLVEKFNLRIHRRDLQTLSGLNWLNDEVINFYMNLLMQRSEERKDLPKVYATNTFFYPKLMQSGQAGLKRWTRKVDIFTHDLMVVPVHLGVHWCLSIVDFQEKKISYLDSMGGRNQACLNALRQYLRDEHQDKKGSPYDVSDWTTECLKDIPQQMNGSDCGMFACTFAEFTCRRAAYNFTQSHMPLLRRKMALEILLGKLLL